MPSPSQLRTFIASVRRRWFASVLLRTVGLGALAGSVPLILALAVDRLTQPQGRALVLLAAGSLTLPLVLLGWSLYRMQRRPDDGRVARFIEEQAALVPGAEPLDDAIVTAVGVALMAEERRPALHGLVVAAANHKLSGLTPSSIVPPSTLRRAGLIAAVGMLVLGVATWRAIPSLVAAAETAWLMWSPDSIQIDVLPGDTRVPAGGPVRIRAVVKIAGRVLTRLEPTLTVSASGSQRTVPMPRHDSGFEFAFESVDRTFSYRITAGSRVSREFTVSALFPPKVKRIDAHYEYPSFTGLAPRDEEDSGDLYAPEGSRVRLRVHTDKPVESGVMSIADGAKTTAFRKTGKTELEAEIQLTKDEAYRVQLTDADGLRGGADTEYFIRLMDDRPPDVRILRPNGDQQVTPLEEVAIEARADDDYGIAAFELVYSVAGQPERTTPFSRLSGTNVAKLGAQLLPVEDLRVQPGDVITYYARARDIGRGKRPTETKSDMFFLEVRPFNEEFVSAQSQAMAGAGDPQLESLISAQKEIINATWNIERRSGVGRSAADVKAVSQAQQELRAKAEQMTRGARGTPVFQLPQQISQPGRLRTRATGADAVASAVKAMGLAVQQLDVEKTKEALPHEMAALQGLLQAQAEIRRRQVSQQANGASGNGYGRQGQDLSALFDKELQRQQRTNYENRSQIEERPDNQQEDSALDRIRDLARRLEDLSSRERELAKSQAPEEEQKRQLDRLTREQQELRERAEGLRRQLDAANQARANGSSPQNGQRGAEGQPGRGASSSASGEMRDATDEMRNAASELQRQDPSSAAARSQRAAEQLRQMEQRLRNGSAAGAQRANGDLRLEAQQLVDAQRRIADETSRLEKGEDGRGSPANNDAKRRLATEKESLADRVDALERDARAMSQGKGSQDEAARAAGDTAADLRRQKIGERMRSSANEMRDGRGTAGERAEAERQIARALDQAVSRLGAGAGADARSLSQQLDESRAIRDRLDRLEEQIRQAESQGRSAQPGSASSGQNRGDARVNAGRQNGSNGPGTGGRSLQQLREEYGRELARAREALGKLAEGRPRDGLGGATPEEQVFSQSAPGNEAFKQDFSKWESLRKGVDLALERYESSVSHRLAKKLAEDRLSAGGSERGPDAYDQLIARYYESLARTKK
jgi:hypothetical protein